MRLGGSRTTGRSPSKSFVAQTNELLCKIVCHNLAVLVSSIYELGIDPTFWAEKAAAHEVAVN